MKKFLLILVVPLLMGVACSKFTQNKVIEKDNKIPTIRKDEEAKIKYVVNNKDCFADDLADCLNQQTKVVGIFDKENLRLTNVSWGDKSLSSLKMTHSDYVKNTTFDTLVNDSKIAIRGNIVKDENNNYAISSYDLLIDLFPDSLDCSSSFGCYIKDIDCSYKNCSGPGGRPEIECIGKRCGCKCSYMTAY